MDLSRPARKHRPSGLATIKGGIVTPRQVAVSVGRNGKRQTAPAPQRRDTVENQSAPPALDADEHPSNKTPAADLVDLVGPADPADPADPSSPMSSLSRTPSLSPEAAERLTEAAAGESASASASATAAPKPQLHIQARLAYAKTELARVYQTKDKTTPPSRRDRPSLIAGPFVRFMARVYTTDIEDVRVQKHLREQVMTPAHFRELMIWHGRAVRERERKAAAAAARPIPAENKRVLTGTATARRKGKKK